MKPFVLFLFLFLTVAVYAQDEAEIAVRANLRSAPSTKAKVLATLAPGDVVSVVKDSGTWLKVEAKGQTGWIHRSVIVINILASPETPPQKILRSQPESSEGSREKNPNVIDEEILPPPQEPAPENTGIVLADSAYLRSTPSTKGKIVATLRKGDSFEIIRRSGDWYRVRAKRRVGWLPEDAIGIAELRMEKLVRLYPESVDLPPTSDTADAAIKARIEDGINKLGVQGVTVLVKNAEVTLTGTVPKNKLAAILKIAMDDDVRKVNSQLRTK